MRKYHTFHIVNPSPWPLLASWALFSVVVSFVGYMHGYEGFFEDFFFHFFNLALVAGFWWRDIIREATFGGHHTKAVQRGLKIGFTLFLVSEAMLFFSFFWAFFYLAVHPSGPYLGAYWSHTIFNDTVQAVHLPFFNTYILLLSGASLTWSHYSLLRAKLVPAIEGLFLTLFFGLIFLFCQFIEYKNARFDISDGVFGSTFYLLTGFHGVHVLVGWIFLGTQLIRMGSGHLSQERHLGFEMAIWYWHFVDVVWLFLFFAVYSYGTHPTLSALKKVSKVYVV